MKHLYLLLFVFLSLRGFTQWETIPVNTGDTLNDIQYVDGSYFVGGQNSAFLRSLDEGDSFELMIHPNGKIGKISFFDSLSGITTWSATYGQSFITIDGGNSWAPTPEWYVTVDAVGDSILYMYKYNIISLSDEQTILSETNIDILVDTNQVTQYETGNIGGWSWVLKSENRGESIVSGSFPYATDYIYQSFAVNSDTICFLQYLDNKLFKSLDEGLNWEVLDVPEFHYYPSYLSHRVFYFDSNLNGFISDYQGNLYKTVDAGDTWQQVLGVESTGLNDITFVNDLEGYLVGDSGLVMSTVDGGSTWAQENSGTAQALNAIDFNAENIIAVGDSGTIIKRPRYLIMGLTVSSLSGESSIITEGGTLQLQSNSLPADASDPSVSWSVENLSGEAIISEAGLLTAVNNGVVLARATSQANPAVVAEMAITISNQPDTSPLTADTLVCLGDTLILNASRPNATYLWQDGSTDSVFTATSGQLFWVTVSNEISTVTDTIYVEFLQPPFVNLGDNSSICEGDTLVLDASGTDADLLWQDGSTEDEFIVFQAGEYWVRAENEACTSSDTVQVNIILLPEVNLGSDTLLCEGETLVLQAEQTNATYLWQDGSTETSLMVQEAGTYSVQITVNGCSSSDSITVEYTICTGIKENEASAIIRAYPNPTSNKLNVQLNKTYTSIKIAVSDAKGTKVMEISIKQSDIPEIDMSSLPSGMYVLTIQTDDFVSSIKVQKQ